MGKKTLVTGPYKIKSLRLKFTSIFKFAKRPWKSSWQTHNGPRTPDRCGGPINTFSLGLHLGDAGKMNLNPLCHFLDGWDGAVSNPSEPLGSFQHPPGLLGPWSLDLSPPAPVATKHTYWKKQATEIHLEVHEVHTQVLEIPGGFL